MSRLPSVGSDTNNWGTILNDFLNQGHNSDGTIIASAIDGSSGVYNVKRYGAIGNGVSNDTTAIQSAIIACAAAGGGTVYLPPGDYKLGAQLNLAAKVVLAGAGRSTRLLQAFWPGTFQGTIQALGTYTDTNITTLTANASAGDVQLTVSSSTGINVGDYLLLGSDRAFSDATLTHDNVRYRGEIVRVSSVPDSTHLNIYGFVQDNYATTDAASVKGITYLDGVGMRDLAIENTDQGNHNSDLVYLLACRNFTFSNVYLAFSDNVGIHLDHCRDGVIVNTRMRDFTDDSANGRFGYGVLFNRATENVVVSTCTFDRLRHSVTTNGADTKRGVPRNIVITGCTAQHMTNAAFDTHNQGAAIIFNGCHANNCDLAGYQIRSQDTKVIACSASYVNTGIILGEMAHGAEVRDNTIRHVVRKNSAGGYGVQVSSSTNGIQRAVIEGNTIDSVARNFIYIQDQAKDILIRRNRCVNPGNDGTSQSGIKVDSAATVSGLQIVDNDLSAFSTPSTEALSSGTLNHAIDLNSTTTNSIVTHNRAINFAGNLVNASNGSGNIVHSNNPYGERARVSVIAQGMKGQTFERVMATSSNALVSGTVMYTLLPVTAGDVISNIYVNLTNSPTSVTLGKVGVYSTGGSQLAVSADDSANWTAAGIRKIALTTPYVVGTDGAVYLAVLYVASTGTAPTLPTASSTTNVPQKVNSTVLPWAALSGQTDMPVSGTPGASGARAMWLGWD